MSTTLGPGIIGPALRVAGITGRPGRIAAPDQSTEAIQICNRMMGSWNIVPLDIYSTSIDRYALSPNQTSYFIGPTGDFVAPRPTRIIRANVVLTTTSPEQHIEVRLLDKGQWAAKRIPELAAGMWPVELYDDFDEPDSKLYLYPFPQVQCDLELFTPKALRRDFAALTDSVDLPDGYERALVFNLAVDIAAFYPEQAQLDPRAEGIADRALAAIESNNAPVPRLKNDAAGIGLTDRRGDSQWWRSGGMG